MDHEMMHVLFISPEVWWLVTALLGYLNLSAWKPHRAAGLLLIYTVIWTEYHIANFFFKFEALYALKGPWLASQFNINLVRQFPC